MAVAKFDWRIKTGYVLVALSFLFNLLSFVSPYWLISWQRIHTPLKNLGLWEFCLNGYVVRNDPSMRSYFGCWWVFSPEFITIYKILNPAWFQAVQAFVTLTLICVWLQLILFSLYMCKFWKHAIYMVRVSKCILILGFACIAFSSTATIVFGACYQDAYWMPYPDLNWPSWSFGCNILCTITEFCATFYVYERMKLDQYISGTHEEDFKMTPNAATGYLPNIGGRNISASTEKLDPSNVRRKNGR